MQTRLIKKDFHICYEDKTSLNVLIVEELEDKHLVIKSFEKGYGIQYYENEAGNIVINSNGIYTIISGENFKIIEENYLK